MPWIVVFLFKKIFRISWCKLIDIPYLLESKTRFPTPSQNEAKPEPQNGVGTTTSALLPCPAITSTPLAMLAFPLWLWWGLHSSPRREHRACAASELQMATAALALASEPVPCLQLPPQLQCGQSGAGRSMFSIGWQS